MFNIEEYIQTLLRLRLGRIQNRHHTVGTGSGQPRGGNRCRRRQGWRNRPDRDHHV
jgi:hypothetical protein